LGLGGSGGSNGLISFHSSSVTHWRAIGRSPLRGPMTLISSSTSIEL
jgi:hypothetical protein